MQASSLEDANSGAIASDDARGNAAAGVGDDQSALAIAEGLGVHVDERRESEDIWTAPCDRIARL